MQEAMLSHGYNKAEALAAEQLFKSLSAQAEAAEQHLPAASHKARVAAAPAAPHAATAAVSREVAAAGANATPRDPKDNVVDYAMFEQLWMADLTAPIAK